MLYMIIYYIDKDKMLYKIFRIIELCVFCLCLERYLLKPMSAMSKITVRKKDKKRQRKKVCIIPIIQSNLITLKIKY